MKQSTFPLSVETIADVSQSRASSRERGVSRVAPRASRSRAGIEPMPRAHIDGPGRDRRFTQPQYFATLQGLRTAFFDGGDRDAKETIVFVHGLAGNSTHWVHLAPRYAGSFRVVGLDLPACGESETPRGPYSVALYADHVRALLDLLGIERATVVGHSLGGMVATSFALTYPDRAERIVLVNPAGFQPLPLPVRLAGHLVLREAFLNRVLPRVWRGILHKVFSETNEHTDAFMRMVRETYRDEDVTLVSSVMAALRPDLLEHNFAEELDRIAVPTWLVWGHQDRLVPAATFHKSAKRMKNVTAEEIPNCGHMPIIEKPQQLIAFIDRALGLS